MTDETTPLDRAHAALEAAPDDDAPRLRFYGRLMEGELFLLLAGDAQGDRIEPRLFPLDEGPYVLVFDREDRLTGFTAGPAPYAAMPGREVARMLAGRGIGLGLNLGAAPSEMLLPAEAVDWLAAMVDRTPSEADARIIGIAAPAGLPEGLLPALDARLATAAGLAQAACLARVTYEGGRQAHLLAFLDPAPGAETALARAMGEVLAFSGAETDGFDVAFFAAADPMADRLGRRGLRFDLPEPPEPRRRAPRPPGSDPDAPPKLR